VPLQAVNVTYFFIDLREMIYAIKTVDSTKYEFASSDTTRSTFANPSFGRHVKPLVPAAYAVVSTGPAWWFMTRSPYVYP
jgi:hypothetical protein